MRKYVILLVVSCCVCAHVARATVFGNIRGIVHDPQHRPVSDATVKLQSSSSDYSQSAQTNRDGEFSFPAVPFGDYSVTVTVSGFSTEKQSLTLASDTSSVLHFQLSIAPLSETTIVTSEPVTAAPETFTPTTLVDRQDIERTPGADLTNSTAMITDFTPGAYLTHD